LARLRSRADQRLCAWDQHPFLNAHSRWQRAKVANEARQTEYNEKVWHAEKSFYQDVQMTLGGLTPVLGPDEVSRLLAQVSATTSIDSIAKTVQLATQRVEEFWKAIHPPTNTNKGPASSSPIRRVAAPTKNRRRRPDPDEVQFAEVKAFVKQLDGERCTQEEICERLGNKPRPPHAKWRNLSWPAAFRNTRYRAAVKTKLSKIVHEEISEFPK